METAGSERCWTIGEACEPDERSDLEIRYDSHIDAGNLPKLLPDYFDGVDRRWAVELAGYWLPWEIQDDDVLLWIDVRK